VGRIFFNKTIVAGLVFFFMVGVLALPAGAQQAVVGEWEFRMTFNEREIVSKMTITQNADGALAGTWGGRRGDTELKDVKYEDEKLTFSMTRTRQDQEFTSNYTLAAEGDKLVGEVTSSRGTRPISLTRIVSDKAVIGTWEMKMSMQDREFTSKLIVSKNQTGVLEGKWESDFGEHTVSNVKFEAGKLTFDRVSKFGDRDRASTFNGTLDGNKLDGAMKSDRGEVTVKGTRKAAGIVGKWELTTTSQRGTRTRILTIKDDMTGTYQIRDGETPIKDLKVDGADVSFKIEMSWNDRSFEMELKGALDGDTFNGKSITERGEREFTGKRVVE